MHRAEAGSGGRVRWGGLRNVPTIEASHVVRGGKDAGIIPFFGQCSCIVLGGNRIVNCTLLS